MRSRSGRGSAFALCTIAVACGFQVAPQPEDELVAVAKAFLGAGFVNDWGGIEQLPGIQWASGPPTMLENCLPDGGCFTLQGAATIGGRNLAVVATGARTMVFNIYIRNTSSPFGQAAVVEALQRADMSGEVARCPVQAGAPGTSWYRLTGENLNPGYLSIQPATTARPGEGFVLSLGEKLPQLQPAQLALYSEECGQGADRIPVSTALPHEQLAETIVSLLLPATGPDHYEWAQLPELRADIAWLSTGPQNVDRTILGDANPWMQSGSVTYSGREFSVIASGTPSQVRTIFFEEMGTHPTGEHLLGVVYEKGFAVQLVRCGPVYTESTNNWHSVTSAATRSAMLRQSIHYDGNLVSDTYELRLDGTLPTRDPRDRDPGTNGC